MDHDGQNQPDSAAPGEGGRPGQRADRSLWRDPNPPGKAALSAVQGRVLDPGTAISVKGIDPRPTAYVGPRLVVSGLVDAAERIARLTQAAEKLDWTLTVRDDVPERGAAVLVRLEIGLADGQATLAPDGWVLLQHARARFGIETMSGVGLDHLVFIRGAEPEPFHDSSPFHESSPFGTAPSAAVATYAVPGSGGRQPVAFVGPAPLRRPDAEIAGRRPVVAVLDTGCGAHPWLDGVVDHDVRLDGRPIGYVDPASAPEDYPDQVGPLDGGIDELAGHGTFIAGLVHQQCPDAQIVSWRVVGSAGPIVESDLVAALTQIAEVARRHRDGEEGGHPIDVLNLSMGYYHETPDDALFDPTMQHLLTVLGQCGTVVVCSAGNDATARPMFPAAFGPWLDGHGPAPLDHDAVPVVCVGALNPSGRSDALFTNAGPWVRVHEAGAAVLSTMPAFEGGLLPMARAEAYQRTRESIDPDNFQGRFAVWSGTSFAAPVAAGKVAAALVGDLTVAQLTAEHRAADRAQARGRARAALAAVGYLGP
ncbi:MAG: S8 family peptidase [Nocardioides sp.]